MEAVVALITTLVGASSIFRCRECYDTDEACKACSPLPELATEAFNVTGENLMIIQRMETHLLKKSSKGNSWTSHLLFTHSSGNYLFLKVDDEWKYVMVRVRYGWEPYMVQDCPPDASSCLEKIHEIIAGQYRVSGELRSRVAALSGCLDVCWSNIDEANPCSDDDSILVLSSDDESGDESKGESNDESKGESNDESKDESKGEFDDDPDCDMKFTFGACVIYVTSYRSLTNPKRYVFKIGDTKYVTDSLTLEVLSNELGNNGYPWFSSSLVTDEVEAILAAVGDFHKYGEYLDEGGVLPPYARNSY
jgi:hypothetical protein